MVTKCNLSRTFPDCIDHLCKCDLFSWKGLVKITLNSALVNLNGSIFNVLKLLRSKKTPNDIKDLTKCFIINIHKETSVTM